MALHDDIDGAGGADSNSGQRHDVVIASNALPEAIELTFCLLYTSDAADE